MRYLIDFYNDATAEQIQNFLTASNCSVVKIFNAFENVYLVESSEELTATSIVESIVNDTLSTIVPHEVFVNEGKTNYTDSTTLDVNSEDQWWMTYSMTGVDFTVNPISVPKRGSGISVYIMDSGIDRMHPEFESADITLLHSFNNDFMDYNGHGTALASLICGKTCSLSSPSVKIVKVFQTGVDLYQSDLVAALDAVLVDVQMNPGKFAVLNMSWAIDRNTYIESKIQKIRDAGVVCVVAAGNDGLPIENVTPAAMTDCYIVGSYNTEFQPSVFSNYTGSYLLTAPEATNYGALDVWAPGENIKVAALDGGYRKAFGTSIAAAIHSAAVAYNFSYVDSAGIIPTSMTTGPNLSAVIWALRWSADKYQILSLTDPKYASSTNYVTAYHATEVESAKDEYFKPSKKIVVFDGKSAGVFLGALWLYDSCELVDASLPPGASVKNMFFEWTPDNVLVDGLSKEFTFPFKLYRGTTVEDMTLTVVVIPPEYINNMPTEPTTNDPVLNMLLTETWGCNNGWSYSSCVQLYCDWFYTEFCRCCAPVPKIDECGDCICENLLCP